MQYFRDFETDAGFVQVDDDTFAYIGRCTGTLDGNMEMDRFSISMMRAAGALKTREELEDRLQTTHGISITDCIEVDAFGDEV